MAGAGIQDRLPHRMSASVPNRPRRAPTATRRDIPYQRILLVFFLFSLPLVNPTVHGDGVGYYAFPRAVLIQHNLRFEEDWRHASKYFTAWRVQADEGLHPNQYTDTGHLENHFTVGPGMLWAPFLIFAHLLVLMWNAFGGHIARGWIFKAIPNSDGDRDSGLRFPGTLVFISAGQKICA